MALDNLSTDEFRERLSKDAHTFATRAAFDDVAWERLRMELYYTPGRFDDPAAYARLLELVRRLDAEQGTGGNVLFYMAVPPSLFGTIHEHPDRAGFHDLPGWKRIVIEKPFGTDLASARSLNQQILAHWEESQVYRIDHYLGKETVQNILAFRFGNSLFEPLWNHEHIDHIQFTVSEAVSVEGRGGYYDRAGVLRDMIQNHMFQVLAYVAMEPPNSFAADDVRDAKARLLQAVRHYSPVEALANSVRGQYGKGRQADGKECPAYRAEPGVNPQSNTETFAALRLHIDNPRWQGVPIYLRSGKALWKRGTEVVVQFKRPTAHLFPGAQRPAANRLIFHIQPDQAIETLLQAKTPGPRMRLQPVNMRFGYGDMFKASRGTGYEVMLYSCMMGDPTLFSRTDFVEAAEHRAAVPRGVVGARRRRVSQLRGRHVGPARGPRSPRARRPALVRGGQPRDPGARAALSRRRSGPAQPRQHVPAPTRGVGGRDHRRPGRAGLGDVPDLARRGRGARRRRPRPRHPARR